MVLFWIMHKSDIVKNSQYAKVLIHLFNILKTYFVRYCAKHLVNSGENTHGPCTFQFCGLLTLKSLNGFFLVRGERLFYVELIMQVGSVKF